MAPLFTGLRLGFGRSAAEVASGPFSATGGNIADTLAPGNGYKYHTFGTPGSLVATGVPKAVEILVVAGGGGGSPNVASGGAGSGGVVYATSYILSQGTYPVTVGGGGPAGTPGSDSVFALLTAKGGGSSGQFSSPTNSTSGGSGAGGLPDDPAWPGAANPAPFYSGKSATQPSQTHPGAPGTIVNYGNSGGTGGGYSPNGFIAGGGGGAGGAGGGPNAYPTNPGNTLGGPGQAFPGFEYPLCFPSPYLPGLPSPGNPIAGTTTPGTSNHYGGGGGGGRHLAGGNSSQGGDTSGGQGGGGRGGDGGSTTPQAGVNYLGGGAGDGNGYVAGTSGGNGVVIIRYLA